MCSYVVRKFYKILIGGMLLNNCIDAFRTQLNVHAAERFLKLKGIHAKFQGSSYLARHVWKVNHFCNVKCAVFTVMAEARQDEDVVSEFLGQNPHLASWVESLRSQCETNKQWRSRREFILRNMEAFPTVQPGVASSSLDRLLSLSMVWANHIFLGCMWVMQPLQNGCHTCSFCWYS